MQACLRFRPCLHNFFLENFRQPGTWYERRLAYTRATAVNSMAGYLIGLGDRHSQNILIDKKSAEVGSQHANGKICMRSCEAGECMGAGRLCSDAQAVHRRVNQGLHAQVVHIDLGIAFEQGRFLNTPRAGAFPPHARCGGRHGRSR